MQRPARAADSTAPESERALTRARGPARARPVGIGTNTRRLVGSHDLVELCRLLHEAVARQMDATIFFLGLYDPASESVEVVWQVEDGVELPGGSFPLGKGFTSEVIRTGESRLIRRWSREGPRVHVQY